MANEKLILSAELHDGISQKLKQIQKELASVGTTPGMNAATSWFEKGSKGLSDFVSAGAGAPTLMSGLGLGALTAAASLGGLTARMKELAEKSLALRDLSRDLNISATDLNDFSEAGNKFGISVDGMKDKLKTTASLVPDLMRNTGSLFEAIQGVDTAMHKAGGGIPFIKRLQGDSGDAIKFFDDIAEKAEEVYNKLGAQKAKMFVKDLGLGDDFTNLVGQGNFQKFRDEIAKMHTKIDPVNPQLAPQAQAFREAMHDLNISVANFENLIGPGFIGGLKNLVDAITIQVGMFKHDFEYLASLFDRIFHATAKETAKQEAAAKKDTNPDNKAFIAPLTPNGRPVQSGEPALDGKSAIDNAFRKKMSFDGGSGGLLHNTSYSESGSGGLLHNSSSSEGSGSSAADALEVVIQSGTHSGVLQAFRDWKTEQDAATGGASGFQNASYGGAGGGLGGISGGTAGSGAGGTGGGSFTGNAGVGHWWNKDHIDHGVDRLMKEAHLTREGAEGLISRWAGVEAPGGPTSVNPKSGAFGIGQWLGARKNGVGSSYDDQLTHAIGELNGSERKAGDALRRAHSMREGAVGASMFERAEGYNARTGVDNWTSKTEATNRGLGSLGNQIADLSGKDVGGTPVDIAQRMKGMGEAQAGSTLGKYMSHGQWCADYVNGVLSKSGSTGTHSSLAKSFFDWGHKEANSQKGDVLVSGHHVGFATGPMQMHKGRMMYPMISGNYGHKVAEGWADPGQYQVRRANGMPSNVGANPMGSADGADVHLHIHEDHNGNMRVKKATVENKGRLNVKPKLNKWTSSPRPSYDA